MGYHHLVAERTSPADGLRSVLRDLRVPQPGGKTASQATRAQIDLLLTRIGSLTEALRPALSGTAPPGDASDSDASDTATRLLLADLAMVAAQFRGNTGELGERLSHAVERARLALEGRTDAAHIL